MAWGFQVKALSDTPLPMFPVTLYSRTSNTDKNESPNEESASKLYYIVPFYASSGLLVLYEAHMKCIARSSTCRTCLNKCPEVLIRYKNQVVCVLQAFITIFHNLISPL